MIPKIKGNQTNEVEYGNLDIGVYFMYPGGSQVLRKTSRLTPSQVAGELLDSTRVHSIPAKKDKVIELRAPEQVTFTTILLQGTSYD